MFLNCYSMLLTTKMVIMSGLEWNLLKMEQGHGVAGTISVLQAPNIITFLWLLLYSNYEICFLSVS